MFNQLLYWVSFIDNIDLPFHLLPVDVWKKCWSFAEISICRRVHWTPSSTLSIGRIGDAITVVWCNLTFIYARLASEKILCLCLECRILPLLLIKFSLTLPMLYALLLYIYTVKAAMKIAISLIAVDGGTPQTVHSREQSLGRGAHRFWTHPLDQAAKWNSKASLRHKSRLPRDQFIPGPVWQSQLLLGWLLGRLSLESAVHEPPWSPTQLYQLVCLLIFAEIYCI